MIHIFLDSVRGQVDDSFVIALSHIWARTLTLVKKGFIIWPTFAISVFIGTEVGFCETRLNINFSAGGEGGGGYSWEFLVEVCRLVLQIQTLFQTKKCFFHTRFQTLPLKSMPARKSCIFIRLYFLKLYLTI